MAQNRKKVIIVGKTGNGKSSLGNRLLGINRFREGVGFNGSTLACQQERNGQFEIVDTPGLFDTSHNRNVARQAEAILDALKLCPEPHAFLFVVKYSRFTAEENSVFDVLQITFGEQYLDYAIVVVTHVDNNVTDAEFSTACRESHQVNELLKRCGRRVVRIDNKNPNREHINTLLQYIDQVSNDGNSCFNNDFMRCHEEVLRRHADINRYDSMLVHEQVDMTAKEIRTEVDREVKMKNIEREERKKKEREEREKQRTEKIDRERKEERLWNIGIIILGCVAAAALGKVNVLDH